MHIFHYQLKLLLRDRIVMFWTFIFPIILATFFNLAFSKLNSSEMFEPAQLAIIEQKENIEFKSLILKKQRRATLKWGIILQNVVYDQ